VGVLDLTVQSEAEVQLGRLRKVLMIPTPLLLLLMDLHLRTITATVVCSIHWPTQPPTLSGTENE